MKKILWLVATVMMATLIQVLIDGDAPTYIYK